MIDTPPQAECPNPGPLQELACSLMGPFRVPLLVVEQHEILQQLIEPSSVHGANFIISSHTFI